MEKKKKQAPVQRGGRAQPSVMHTAFHSTRCTRTGPPGVHSWDPRWLANGGRPPCLPRSTGGVHADPARSWAGFSSRAGQREDLWAQRDPDICAPSTSSANLPGQQQTEGHAVGRPSVTSTNAAFVRRPEPPVHKRTSPAVSGWAAASTTPSVTGCLNLSRRGCQPRALPIPSWGARGRTAKCSIID